MRTRKEIEKDVKDVALITRDSKNVQNEEERTLAFIAGTQNYALEVLLDIRDLLSQGKGEEKCEFCEWKKPCMAHD